MNADAIKKWRADFEALAKMANDNRQLPCDKDIVKDQARSCLHVLQIFDKDPPDEHSYKLLCPACAVAYHVAMASKNFDEAVS